MTLSALKATPIIGITGPARSGKDTAAQIIRQIDADRHLLSFADPIKHMLHHTLLEYEELHGDKKDQPHPVYGCTPRHMMQTLGTEWGRNLIHPDVWVLNMHSRIRQIPYGRAVIPDVRFQNEASYVRLNGILIHITGRGGIEGNHQSEKGIDFAEGDLRIDNSGDQQQLEQQIKALFGLAEDKAAG